MGDVTIGTARAYAFFTAAKVGVAGLTVAVDYRAPNGSITTGAGATAAGIDGGYYFDFPASAKGTWFYVFTTADGSVDQQHIAGVLNVDPAGVHPG